jgi:HD superfamily phosphohydrolase
MKYLGEITDPIHKNIKFTLVEKELIDSFIFQRLRRIRQLAGAFLVYPGAMHTRFEHSIGSMFLAGLAGQTLYDKGYVTDADCIQKLRLSALLHDIGHGPFSHLFEEACSQHRDFSHEEMGQRIINLTEIGEILKNNGYDPLEISSISFGKHKIPFMNEIISGGLSADLMDYLPRDSYFTGTEYGKIDYHRIINSLEVTSKKVLGINKSALYSYESMLISRYQMFKAVYFHKTVRAGEVMLLNAIKLQGNKENIRETVYFETLDDFFKLHDELVLEKLCNQSDPPECKEDPLSSVLARDYRNRRLLKCVYEFLILSSQKNLDKRNSPIEEGDSSEFGEMKLFEKQVKQLKTLITDYQNSGIPIFLDISQTPSIPLAPKKEEVSSIAIMENGSEYEKSFSQIPLIKAITGYLDMLRIYATKEIRGILEKDLHDAIN